MIGVIEDDCKVQLLISAILRKNGFEFKVYSSVEEYGLDKKNHGRFESILLDNYLPGVNGLDALTTCAELKHVAVIVMTAASELNVIGRAFENGAVDFIAKPFNESELLARLNKNIEISKNIEHMSNELESGRTIQLQSYPDFYSCSRSYKFFYTNRPKGKISGDIYENIEFENKDRLIFFGDVCGHGMKSGIISMTVCSYFKSLVSDSIKKDDIVEYAKLLNTYVQDHFDDESYLTCLFCFYEHTTKKTYVWSFAHPYIAIVNVLGEMNFLSIVNNPPVGISSLKEIEYRELSLGENESLLFFTDGVGERLLLKYRKHHDYIKFNVNELNIINISNTLTSLYEMDDDISFLHIVPNNHMWDNKEHILGKVSSSDQLHDLLVESRTGLLAKFNKVLVHKILVMISEYISNCFLYGSRTVQGVKPLVIISICKLKGRVKLSFYHNTGAFEESEICTKDYLVNISRNGRGLYILRELSQSKESLEYSDLFVSKYIVNEDAI